jgi:hypothetical protein
MSWNPQLDRTMQPPLIAGSQAARLTLAIRERPPPDITAKLLPVAASSLATRLQNFGSALLQAK